MEQKKIVQTVKGVCPLVRSREKEQRIKALMVMKPIKVNIYYPVIFRQCVM